MAEGQDDDARISEIMARAEAATLGPWQAWPDGTEESVESVSLGRFVCHLNSNMRQFREDAAFISHAREDVPYLLARLDALAAEASDVARENEALIEEVKAAGEQIAVLTAERDALRGWQDGQTHYVGCWREHRRCALTTIDFEAARRERAELALREAVAELNRLREGQDDERR